MSRVRRGFKARQRRNKILKMAKGFHFSRRTKFRHAAQTVKRAMHYMFQSRKLLKRDMRKIWITRINAACKMFETSYSQFIGNLKKKDIQLNRKMISEIAARDPKGFEGLIKSVRP
jgi:large subunit ribosomal protein L20